jgi:hypothetical protein
VGCGSADTASRGGVRASSKGVRASAGEVRGWAGGRRVPAEALDRCRGGAGDCAGAVSTVAKGHSRSTRGTARAGKHGRGLCAARGESAPRRIPDCNRPSPHADGLAGKLPSGEGTLSSLSLPARYPLLTRLCLTSRCATTNST